MPAPRAAVGAALVTVAGMIVAGCGAGGGSDDVSAPSPATVTGGDVPSRPEGPVTIRITIGDQRFAATLADSAAGRDLIAQLPLTIGMTDHGSVEKTGPLPSPLSLDGQPDGADPGVGDVGYYAPGNDFVLYYGDQSYYPGIVILGRLDGDAAGRIAALDGDVTATVELPAG